MKKITIVWTITLILIITCLTILGFKIKSDNIDNIMEKSLIKNAEKYLGLYTNEYPKKGEESILTSEKLEDMGYDSELENNCKGYVVIKNEEMGFTYKAYIKCDNYTTKGYDESKQK